MLFKLYFFNLYLIIYKRYECTGAYILGQLLLFIFMSLIWDLAKKLLILFVGLDQSNIFNNKGYFTC